MQDVKIHGLQAIENKTRCGINSPTRPMVDKTWEVTCPACLKVIEDHKRLHPVRYVTA
jgi:hypothetical protein